MTVRRNTAAGEWAEVKTPLFLRAAGRARFRNPRTGITMTRLVLPAYLPATWGLLILMSSHAAAAPHTVEAGQTLALNGDLVLTGHDVLDTGGTPVRPHQAYAIAFLVSSSSLGRNCSISLRVSSSVRPGQTWPISLRSLV